MSGDASAEVAVADLEIRSIIGYDGSTLRVHPDGVHVVYPLGNKVSILHWGTRDQHFLAGHTNTISALDVSRSGKYIASGQINHIGFKAWVILWDFATRTIKSRHELHKVRVEAVAFSMSDMYLISLGGRDCGSIVVWEVETDQAISGTSASRGIQGEATALYTMNRRDACFLTAGDGNLMLWRIDRKERCVHGTDVNMSKLKRVVYCVDMNGRDEICYCGTSTGDILKVRLNYHHDVDVLDNVKRPIMVGCFAKFSRKKLPGGTVDLYAHGVRALKILPSGNLLVGAGDGTVDLVSEQSTHKTKSPEPNNIAFKLPSAPELIVLKSTKVHGPVTSIQLFCESEVLVATSRCEVYSVDVETFVTKLLVTCHTSTIYAVAFPHNFSDVFATAGMDDVRVWSMRTTEELLRIRVANFSCSSVVFTIDGRSILTAWNDGVIRSFTPLTGRLIYAIMNAHNKGVSALAVTTHGRTLISGGCEGQVRLWNVSPTRQELMCTLKEHKGPVSAVHINHTDDEAVSASTDGTCIIWDVLRQVRKQILFANTLFMSVKYFPTGVQILTAGSDRKVSYWEVLDGSLVRELDGSNTGALNSIDIHPRGTLFVSGGNDQIVKLWKYQEGITTHIGLGHSAVVTAVCFSPDGKYIVSTSASGSIFVWKVPEALQKERSRFMPNDEPEQNTTLKLDTRRLNGPAARGEEDIRELETVRSHAASVASKASSTKSHKSTGSHAGAGGGSGDDSKAKKVGPGAGLRNKVCPKKRNPCPSSACKCPIK